MKTNHMPSRLRDVTNEQEAELMLKVKELEMENYELAEIKGKYMVHLMTLFFYSYSLYSAI